MFLPFLTMANVAQTPYYGVADSNLSKPDLMRLAGALQKTAPSANEINYGNCKKCGNRPHPESCYSEVTALYE
jgi:hypothetical protein